MCSVIDQQKELVPCNFIVDRKFIHDKIDWHCAYIVEVAASDRNIERKKELIESSMAALTRFCTQVDLDLSTALILAMKLTHATVQMKMAVSKPKLKTSHTPGGVAMVGEKELIINEKELIINQHLKRL